MGTKWTEVGILWAEMGREIKYTAQNSFASRAHKNKLVFSNLAVQIVVAAPSHKFVFI